MSLFDLAAGLSQFAAPEKEEEEGEHEEERRRVIAGNDHHGHDASRSSEGALGFRVCRAKAPSAHGAAVTTVSGHGNNSNNNRHHHDGADADHGETVLGLLDQTLEAIYASRRGPVQNSPAPTPTPMSASTSAPAPAAALGRRRQSEPEVTTRSAPLQRVFTQSVSYTSLPGPPPPRPTASPPPPETPVPLSPLPPPSLVTTTPNPLPVPRPPPPTLTMGATAAVDADSDARTALRELQEELQGLVLPFIENSPTRGHLQRALTEKYLANRLLRLPGTPFVLLARRKAQDKIAGACASPTPVPLASTSAPSPLQLPPTQHAMLERLLQLPDQQVARLGPAQRELVQFARRYDKIRRLRPEELRKLPITQQQMLAQLGQQLQQRQQLKPH